MKHTLFNGIPLHDARKMFHTFYSPSKRLFKKMLWSKTSKFIETYAENCREWIHIKLICPWCIRLKFNHVFIQSSTNMIMILHAHRLRKRDEEKLTIQKSFSCYFVFIETITNYFEEKLLGSTTKCIKNYFAIQ